MNEGATGQKESENAGHCTKRIRYRARVCIFRRGLARTVWPPGSLSGRKGVGNGSVKGNAGKRGVAAIRERLPSGPRLL